MEVNEIDSYDTLEIGNLRDTPYRIGKLTNEISELLGLDIGEKDIIVWKDRIKYFEKHKNDFLDKETYKMHIEAIPLIIQSPDYVGKHPSGESLEYIKIIDEIILVAVRIKIHGNLVVRSAYPIKETKLINYLKSGRIIRV